MTKKSWSRTVPRIVFLISAVVYVIPAWAQNPPKVSQGGAPYEGEGSRVVGQLEKGEFEGVAANFDSHLAQELPAAKLAEQWKQFAAQAGAFKRITGAEVTKEAGGYHEVATECEYERLADANVLVTFDGTGKIAGLYFGPRPTEELPDWRAPSYADASQFTEMPLTLRSGVWRLPAVLTLPKGQGPFPAVLLVPGSPPIDEDATVGPNKLFKDIAWGLASRGIAVLRYAKRSHAFGAGLGLGQVSYFTLHEEATDDARAALAVLGQRKEIDHRHTFVLGHSLGGYAAPQIAAENSGVAGIVIMGSPAGDLLQALIQRMDTADTGSAPEAAAMKNGAEALKKIRSGELRSGGVVELFGERVPIQFWSEQRSYQAGTATAKLQAPALVLIAKHDAEVPPDDVDAWKSALAGRKDDQVKFYADLFHLFMPSTAAGVGDSPEDWGRPAHVSAEVVEDIASWVMMQSSKRSTSR